MDVELCAGGHSTRRKMDSAGEGTVEVVPLELYDSARAKIDANLRWLFAKAYGIDHIPEDLRDPFYTDQYEQEHIKPPVLHLLLSCELYCRVCALILKTDQAASLQSHLSVIQALSRKGIYVMESDDTPVTEADLACVPIKMSAHMPMVDALMMAYTVEMISIEKVVACVKRFSTFSASKELPFDLEDAMVFWINKVNLKMREITERELKVKHHPLESPNHQKSPSKWYWKLVPVRYRREHTSGRQLPFFPLLEDLMRDVCDGAALLTVVHYYCPNLMKLDDICLKEVTSIADSLYNIQLLKEFANEYLNKSFYLTIEDMLYSPLVLKHNVMVFIAEFFWWFETVKPEFVQPRTEEFKDARSMAQPKSARPSVPISNATKRSFQVTPGITEASLSVSAQSSPDVSNRYFLHPAEDSDPLTKGGPAAAFSTSHPLLPLRQRQQKQQQGEDGSGIRNRSNSLENRQPRGSVQAWPDKRQRPMSTLNPYTFGISATDSDADIASGDSVSLARSISKDSLASNVANLTPKHQGLTPQGHTLIGPAQVGRAPVSPAPRRVNGHGLLGNVNMEEEEEQLVSVMRTEASTALPSSPQSREATQPTAGARPKDSFYLEPLMPAVLKSAKEKSVCLNKEEESGEVGRSWGAGSIRRVEGVPGLAASARRKIPTSLNRTSTPTSSGEFAVSAEASLAGPPQGQGACKNLVISSVDQSSREPPGGFYLHSDSDNQNPGQDLEPDLDEADEEDLDEALTTKDPTRPRKAFDEEEESAKLQEDLKEKEDKDKGDDGGSGRSSPCLSTHSQASSLASGSIRMTSFAERKAQQRFGSNHDLRPSASSSQRTTPDGSECSGPLALPTSWRLKRDQSPSSPQGGRGDGGTNLLASELVQLHMQLEEKRKAIEHQKKKMEVLSARHRQKLGKAAFLHIVKKGKSDTLPHPLKPDYNSKEELKGGSSKDDSCLDALRVAKETGSATSPVPDALEMVERKCSGSTGMLLDEELDLNECNRSIEMLNDAIGSIQQQMMQLSLQQDLLMKQNVQSPPGPPPPNDKTSGSEPKAQSAAHFVEMGSGAPTTGTAPTRKPPKLTSARGPRSKPSELKLVKEHGRQGLTSSRAITPTHSLETLPHLRQFPGGRSPRADPPDTRTPSVGGETIGVQDKPGRSATFRLNDEANLRTMARIDPVNVTPEVSFECLSSTLREGELNSSDSSGKENVPLEEVSWSKAPLIEVDLKDPEGDCGQNSTMDGEDGEQKSGLGFFFKDEQKAEDELAKKRAAFLVRQQKKAEDARLRKLQLESETEQKREESRRKAEEDRMRKEEEKARRELIKEQYLRRKQQELMEEQGLGSPAKPKTPKTKPKKPSHQTHRPKSAFSREESSSDTFSSKCSSSTPDNLSSAQSGSSLSLASAATTEADSVNSGGAGSQRGESESFPGLSRNASRNTERDWDNGSTASSINSMAEYTGPKLFKEPSSKSNKPIIFNAISHCCLAGKVNEPQKNTLLEELEKVEAHHLMILFRDGGCQFRGVYSFFPDTEEILKLTGTGPKSISKKMIDKLYKYSSDRKQFTVIPAKTVSVSIDAITIHNHLWQAKRTTVPKKSGK
ncbi:calmodulin-regulated spectrin-associated protein 1-B isoform X1 [Oncorhynchus kisutch]|uniref:Calmodulin regulated spectrin-associated protein 1b n=1 Tax=Oncorhynchus kisutch TaxID=8019 RepID=A0A8C7HCM2_ONCKI|nr:calmodulin-regulated spectrin-associated protein 1 isoform X1 [Oncorhynchus kisutch]